MGALDWLRPPRHLLVLFAGVTLVPAAALVWMGWRSFEHDQAFEEQQIHARLKASSERVASGIARQLDATVRALPDWISQPPDTLKSDAVIVRISRGGVVAKAGGPLLFTPIPAAGVIDQAIGTADQARWAEAEVLEYRERNLEKAVVSFKAIAGSADQQTRAAALVATARNLRSLGRLEEALEIYRTLAGLTTTSINGEPSDLVARATECKLLEQLGRRDELSRAARALADDLRRGRWTIDRATLEVRATEVRAWTALLIGDDDLARAAALESFWAERQSKADVSTSGNRVFLSHNRGVVLIWRTVGEDVVALAAGKDYVFRTWESVLRTEDARTSFEGADPYTVKVRATDVNLPWDLYVSDTSAAADAASFATRRRLLAWSLAALVILIPAGGYVVWRAVQKELAVARLQADFVSAVSHEFRTPLTSMSHLTERLQRDGSISDDRRRQYYDVLARDTDRLRRFVETLLDFGRMEAGASSVRTKADDLSAVVADVVAEFRGETAATGRDIRVETNGALPAVKLDREAFGRALWNLLDNASKYSPAGSPIMVAIRRETNTACVDVSDLGAGIPVSERRQVFQKFVRGEDPKTSDISGTGIGLALVDRIIRAHGGEVRLESIVGQGSTFSLVLPIAGAES